MENCGYRKCQIEVGESITKELQKLKTEILDLHKEEQKEDSLLDKQQIHYKIVNLRGKQDSLNFMFKTIQGLTPPHVQKAQ